MNYLDAASFTRLFRAPRRNHAAICLGLNRMASGVGRRLWFGNAIEREDAVANALLYAIERIDRFRFTKGRDAFAYFSSVLYNRMVNRLGRERRTWRPVSFSDLHNGDEVRSRRHLEESAVPYAKAG